VSTKKTNESNGKTPTSVEAKNVRRDDRLELQRTSARLLPQFRVSHCLWTPTGKASLVELLLRKLDARFTGIQTCGSLWHCTCCSAKISEVRRQELRRLEEWAGSPKRGLRLVMMTLTARHRKRPLKDMVKRLAAAKVRLQNRQPFRPLRESGVLFGSISVREATHGEAHGWHPHYHVLCLIRADSDETAMALLEPLRQVWLECLRKEGLTGTADRAFHLQNGDAVAAYISKHGRDADDRKAATEARPAWGIAEEMTLSRTKKGRGEEGQKGRSPWQILRDAHAGEEASERLWQEYGIVFHGKPQQVWSNGLKEAVGLKEVSDEEAAEGEEYTEDPDKSLWAWSPEEWAKVRHLRGKLLAAAEAGGEEAVRALLGKHRAGTLDDEADSDVIEGPKAPDPLKHVPGKMGSAAMAALSARRNPPGSSPLGDAVDDAALWRAIAEAVPVIEAGSG